MVGMRARLFAALIVLLCVRVACAQETATKSSTQAAYVPSMTFDVASVRESNPDPVAGFAVSFVNPSHSSLLRVTNNDVPNLLAAAYGVNRFQLIGLPDWASGHWGPFFTIEAKANESVDQQLAKLSDEQA